MRRSCWIPIQEELSVGMTQKLAAPPGKYYLCIVFGKYVFLLFRLKQVEIKELSYCRQRAQITDPNHSFSKWLTEQYKNSWKETHLLNQVCNHWRKHVCSYISSSCLPLSSFARTKKDEKLLQVKKKKWGKWPTI